MGFFDTSVKYLNDKGKDLAGALRSCGPEATTILLSGIFLTLREIAEASSFGNVRFDLRPVSLNTVPIRILERDETTRRVRKVSLWVDSASGGPTPTIRVGKGTTSVNGGGIRVNAGQVNEIGEVPADVELWAAASTPINAYIIEHA